MSKRFILESECFDGRDHLAHGRPLSPLLLTPEDHPGEGTPLLEPAQRYPLEINVPSKKDSIQLDRFLEHQFVASPGRECANAADHIPASLDQEGCDAFRRILVDEDRETARHF
jgi:hypothetical protein